MVNEPVTIDHLTSDVQIPQYNAIDVPFVEQEGYRHRELLKANGFADTPDGWREATQHENGLIREAAYYLLTRAPKQLDKNLLQHGLTDSDQTVRATVAYGLYKLGDESMLTTLEEIAALDVNVFTAATRAAGFLGELGNPFAFSTIEHAMASEFAHIRLFGINHAMPFVVLNGKPYTTDAAIIDVWRLYAKAMQDESSAVRSAAQQQLQELGTSEALKLLEQ